MNDHQYRNRVLVIGHKHPDTDAICSAISYSWLKNQLGGAIYEPCRAGQINRETEFVLRHFGVEAPQLCEDVRPQIKDAAYRVAPGIDAEMSLKDAWDRMISEELDTLCITDVQDNFKGIITVKDIGKASMNYADAEVLSHSRTLYENLAKTLAGQLLIGDGKKRIETGKICIGTSPEMMEGKLEEGDLVLVTNRYETQSFAIESGASCMVVCCGVKPSEPIIRRATERGCTVITTPLDTYGAAKLVGMAVPVRYRMVTEHIQSFHLDTNIEDVRKVMAGVRHRYFPVLDQNGKYCGVISRRNLLNPHRKRLIMVDHNEKIQAVSGLEEAEILEIVDHHRLGALETAEPLVFRNLPVGCTCTILYQIYQEKGIVPPKQIAGLMLSAILSDTLMFRSATCTELDRKTAEELARIAEVNIEEYAEQMFRAGEDLSGRTAEEIVFSDLKEFRFGNMTVAVGQSLFMTESVFQEAEKLLQPYLLQAYMKTGASMIFYMLTFTPEKRTRLLFCGNGAAELVQDAFHLDPSSGRVDLPGVVSRKKQLIPPLRAAVKEEQTI